MRESSNLQEQLTMAAVKPGSQDLFTILTAHQELTSLVYPALFVQYFKNLSRKSRVS